MCWNGTLNTHYSSFARKRRISDGSVPISSIFTQVVERRGDRDGALALFNEAVRICPTNALVRYRRAKINIATRKYIVSQVSLF